MNVTCTFVSDVLPASFKPIDAVRPRVFTALKTKFDTEPVLISTTLARPVTVEDVTEIATESVDNGELNAANDCAFKLQFT